MSHPAQLIQSIASKLSTDYPFEFYDYVLEKRLPGTSFLPDIAVYDKLGAVVCLVEIGYTRPEKLTYYARVMGVKDVRWYDKQGHLHAEDVFKRVESHVVNVVVNRPDVVAWLVKDASLCDNCYGDAFDDNASVADLPSDEELDAAEAEALFDVFTIAMRCANRWAAASFCDKCGEAWADEDVADIVGACEADTGSAPDDASMFHRERWRGSLVMAWNDARRMVEEQTGQSLDAMSWQAHPFEPGGGPTASIDDAVSIFIARRRRSAEKSRPAMPLFEG